MAKLLNFSFLAVCLLNRQVAVAVGLVALSLTTWGAEPSGLQEEDKTAYYRVGGVAGRITSVGSDTLNNLMTEWAEAFSFMYPSVKAEIQGLGSSTAPPALTQGTSNFAPMSRRLKRKEIAVFEKKHGYAPLKIPVAVDMLAVFVHRDNPIQGLSIVQLDSIFSSTRRCGARTPSKRWGEVGVTDAKKWKKKRIRLYGRNSASGTYGYFKQKALCKGDYSTKVSEQSGSAAVVLAIANDRGGIGYSGMGYQTSGVRAVPLSREGKQFVAPTHEAAVDASYPLARYLYIYVNKKPNQPLPLLEQEFLKMILSNQGQDVVRKNGYVPLPSAIMLEARKLLL